MPLIYFVRHGQTSFNAEKRLQGMLDVPINATGHLQAKKNGGLLNELISDKSRFDFVSSPLLRARQTMEIIRREMGLPAEGYRTDDRLKEVSYGSWAGLTWPEIEARDPEAFARRQADRWTVAPPGGQTHQEVYALVGGWLSEVSQDTVVVAHYGTARDIRGHVLKLSLQQILDLDAPQDKVLMIDGQTVTWLG